MLGNGPYKTCTTHPTGVGDCTFAGRQHCKMAKSAAGQILAFAPVGHNNPAAVDAAMAAFHGTYAGVNLSDDADSLFQQGKPWTTAHGERPGPNEGHCILEVPADGHKHDTWVTWGRCSPQHAGGPRPALRRRG